MTNDDPNQWTPVLTPAQQAVFRSQKVISIAGSMRSGKIQFPPDPREGPDSPLVNALKEELVFQIIRDSPSGLISVEKIWQAAPELTWGGLLDALDTLEWSDRIIKNGWDRYYVNPHFKADDPGRGDLQADPKGVAGGEVATE